MSIYKKEYFNDEIFSTDYSFLASVISEVYKPRRIIEFGCGPGHLAKAFADQGISVTAIDGYADPDFADLENIEFIRMDLNDPDLHHPLFDNPYDLAVCTEVAEHLNPESSASLIKMLTKSAPVVIFSAAVPEQGGHGHINCQSRVFWHDLFVKDHYLLMNSLRTRLRDNSDLAIWYRLNVLDYVSEQNQSLTKDVWATITRNLLSDESYSSSMYYKRTNEAQIFQAYLNYPLVREYMSLRKFFKKLLR
ncbi:class I SAM-dependent methyltransferase [Paradesertivirga mongoliensis]|uniref:Class I SAM-dependent methyltransferase n=1 Tax=Paradesertivirga mongoliensis TaxID=2100740 RepID=A0ABW4ZG86_9SPHI|nr:class I SAM-dependent methyltransferase [Pedobacter mongoliensis]